MLPESMMSIAALCSEQVPLFIAAIPEPARLNLGYILAGLLAVILGSLIRRRY